MYNHELSLLTFLDPAYRANTLTSHICVLPRRNTANVVSFLFFQLKLESTLSIVDQTHSKCTKALLSELYNYFTTLMCDDGSRLGKVLVSRYSHNRKMKLLLDCSVAECGVQPMSWYIEQQSWRNYTKITWHSDIFKGTAHRIYKCLHPWESCFIQESLRTFALIVTFRSGYMLEFHRSHFSPTDS